MNSVERVKAICAERKIAISKLEKDLGFGNGYIGQLRKGTFPADRLAKIAEYLSVTSEYLLTGQEKKPATLSGDELDQKLEGVDFALNGAVKDLTDAQKRDVLKFVEFLKSKDD